MLCVFVLSLFFLFLYNGGWLNSHTRTHEPVSRACWATAWGPKLRVYTKWYDYEALEPICCGGQSYRLRQSAGIPSLTLINSGIPHLRIALTHSPHIHNIKKKKEEATSRIHRGLAGCMFLMLNKVFMTGTWVHWMGSSIAFLTSLKFVQILTIIEKIMTHFLTRLQRVLSLRTNSFFFLMVKFVFNM